MIVCVRGIDFQPVFDSVATALRMLAFALPIFFGHVREKLGRIGARGTKGVERRSYVACVVIQAGCEKLLIVAVDDRMVFDEQEAQAYSTGRFAVCQVMNNLGGAPFTWNRVGCQGLRVEPLKAVDNFVVSCFVPGDQFFS